MSYQTRVFFVFIVSYNVLSCAVVSMSMGFIISFAFDIAVTLFLYVGACDRPPPREDVSGVRLGQLAFADR